MDMKEFKICCNCEEWKNKKADAVTAICSLKQEIMFDFDDCREGWSEKRPQLPGEQKPVRREDSVWMSPGGIPMK